MSAIRLLLHRRHRGALAGVCLVAISAAGVAWYIGMDAGRATAVGIVALGLGIAWIVVPEQRSVRWPRPVHTARDGARRDVVQLSWSLRTSLGRVQPGALARVRELARRRLAARSLALDDPADAAAIEQLIGAAAYAVLRPGDGLPTLRSLLHCLDALDRLGAPPLGPFRQPSAAEGESHDR